MKTLVALTLFFKTLDGSTFMEENNLHEEISLLDGGITEEQFNSVIARTEKIYEPIFKDFGAELVVEKLWANETVNAYANQASPVEWQVHMFGGLARRPEVTEDGFAMVLCHEIGHHLGGYPFVDDDWAANEGQSDMHATGACAQKVFSENSVLSFTADNSLPENMKAKCRAAYTDVRGVDVCQRAMLAGKSLADLLAGLQRTKVSFDTPDKSKVRRTNNDHPKAQCRLDTYVASALCGAGKWDYGLIPGKAVEDHFSVEAQKEAYDHSCPEGVGARPACWFAELK